MRPRNQIDVRGDLLQILQEAFTGERIGPFIQRPLGRGRADWFLQHLIEMS
jgi:hypothetical protein